MNYSKYGITNNIPSLPPGAPDYKETFRGRGERGAGLFTELTKSINKLVSTEQHGERRRRRSNS